MHFLVDLHHKHLLVLPLWILPTIHKNTSRLYKHNMHICLNLSGWGNCAPNLITLDIKAYFFKSLRIL